MPEMCWLDPNNGNGEKVLHLRLTKGDRWLPYTAPQFSHLRQGRVDGVFMGVRPSKGFRLAQYLLSQGWEYVPSPCVSRLEAIVDAQKNGLVQGY
jgi:hypothetical protein